MVTNTTAHRKVKYLSVENLESRLNLSRFARGLWSHMRQRLITTRMPTAGRTRQSVLFRHR